MLWNLVRLTNSFEAFFDKPNVDDAGFVSFEGQDTGHESDNFVPPAPSTFSSAISPPAAGPGGAASSQATTTPAPTLITSNTTAGSNLSFDLAWDSSVASAGSNEAGFMRAVKVAARFYANNFTTPTPVTITIDVGYGEVDGSALALGAASESSDNGDFISYNTLYAAMKHAPKSVDWIVNAYFASELPTPGKFAAATGKSANAADIFVTYSEEQALGLTPAYTYGQPDGWIGLAANDPGGFLGTGLFATPMDYYSDTSLRSRAANTTGGYDAVAAAAHEIGEVMGRINGLGATLVPGTGATWTPLDLARYSTKGAGLDLTSAQGYFSVNGGAKDLGDYDNGGGDPGDWAQSNPLSDAYDGYFSQGNNLPVTDTDILENAVLGYQLTATGYANAGGATGPRFI
jgi:hypothetical protein